MLWGKAGKAKKCAHRFIDALNARDVDTMAAMMADDFCYIDSWREGVEGRDKVLAGLRVLLDTEPALRLTVESTTYSNPDVLMSGRIETERFGNRKALWLITCDGRKLSQWQSWAEGGPPPMSRTLSPGEARDLSHRAADPPMPIEG